MTTRNLCQILSPSIIDRVARFPARLARRHREPLLAAFLHGQSGAALIYTALMLPMLLGAAGLGVDATLWYLDKRVMQNVADGTAVTAAHVVANGGSAAAAAEAATAEAASLGYPVGSDFAISVNTPPAYGPNTGKTGFAEVIVETRRKPLLISMVYKSEVSVQGRAVAGPIVAGRHCVIALDQTIEAALEFTGTSDVDVGCGVASNSNSHEAVLISGNATLNAEPAQAYGDIRVQGSATLNSNQPVQSLSQRVVDPYGPEARGLQPPAPSSCDENGRLKVNGNTTLTPGRYCGGIKINGGSVVFEPGTFVIDAGDFEAGGNATMTGTGVSFVFTADNPNNIGGLKITGGPTANLTAPGSEGGIYAGVLFYQDQAAPSYQGSGLILNSVLGGSTTSFNGAIYFPNQEVKFSGGASNANSCLQIIARKVTFTGNADIAHDPAACDTMQAERIDQVRVAVAE